MVQFNTRANEILLKLVYYGPGLSGKTTNLQMLHTMCQAEDRGELFSVNTQEDRTLFFDLLPIKLGTIYGNAIHLQVFTVPGQVQYDASRRVVLGGADGVVFVADSSEAKMQENVDSLSNLYHNLNANRLNIKEIPFVLQYNKRDLGDAMAVGVMNRRLNFRNVDYFESVALKGAGVLETFLAIAKETVISTFRKYHLEKKVKDLDELLTFVDASVRSSMKELPTTGNEVPSESPNESTVLRSEKLSVDDLVPGVQAETQDLLEDSVKTNMEMARLYGELKQAKHLLEKKVEETNALYIQLERANQDSLKTRRYLEGLLNGVGEGIVSFSQDGRVLTWNAAAERMFGYARSEIIGHSFHALVPSSRAGELEAVIGQVSKGQVVRDMPTTRLKKDGQEFPVSITFSPIRGNDERVLAFSALVRDQEERAFMAKRLESAESNNSLAQLIPTLFNEFSNRLASVTILKEKLLDVVPDPQGQFIFERFFHTLDHAQDFLKPLLLLISPPTMRRSLVSLTKVLQNAIERTEGEASAGNVTVDLNLDPTLPEASFDQDQMEAAMLGLLRYCIHVSSMSSVRRVRLGSRLVGSSIQLICQDTGQAITTPEDDSVFSISNVKDGYTLGLCVASSVIKAHGGRISVRSQAGVGNAFLMEVPVTNLTSMNVETAGLNSKKVLVVDDEELLLECLVDAIQGWGCATTSCKMGAEAIEKLQVETFDLIVSDIRMPGLSGIQLFDWIQSHQPAMAKRIIYTTGDSFDPETRAFLDKSQLPHLGKPFDLKRLKEAMAKLA